MTQSPSSTIAARSLFFFWAFSEVSALLKCWRAEVLAAVVWADQELRGQCWPMSLVVARDRRLALASATTVFLSIWPKLFNSRSLFCNSARIDGLRLSRKYLSIVSLTEALIRSYANKIDYKCSKCAAHSNTDSC